MPSRMGGNGRGANRGLRASDCAQKAASRVHSGRVQRTVNGGRRFMGVGQHVAFFRRSDSLAAYSANLGEEVGHGCVSDTLILLQSRCLFHRAAIRLHSAVGGRLPTHDRRRTPF